MTPVLNWVINILPIKGNYIGFFGGQGGYIISFATLHYAILIENSHSFQVVALFQ